MRQIEKLEKIKFGTDGWRGVISDNFTFDNVRRVGVAIADYYSSKLGNIPKGAKTIIAVGYDTRFLSEDYARIISEVLASKGIKVILSDKAIPTPTLSFAVKLRNLAAGVMITASHNPAIYNGIKIKTASGAAAGVKITRGVEKRLPSRPVAAVVSHPDFIIKKDLTRDYIKFLRSYIDLGLLKKTRFRLLVDAMYGSGNGIITQVLKDTRNRVDLMRTEFNPSFGGFRPEPVIENLGSTIGRLKTGSYDLALVLDGDADRIAGFTSRGEFIHPQKILGLLILHLVANRKMKGGVVKTIASTALIDRITDYLGLKLYETSVGFKYISQLMENEDILIGGEEAGGIGFKGFIPERDGSLAGLLLIEMMAYQKKSMLMILNEMEKKFGRFYYLRKDIYFPKYNTKIISSLSSKLKRFKSRKKLLGKIVTRVKDFDGVKLICQDQGWLMLRVSGTEPLVRVYAEARSLVHAKELLNFGTNFIGIG